MKQCCSKYCGSQWDAATNTWICMECRVVTGYTYNNLKTLFSCCGGMGASVWDSTAGAWKCKDCGTATSTDPSYTGKISIDEQPQWPSWVKKCTCGSTKTYGVGATHSSWCDVRGTK